MPIPFPSTTIAIIGQVLGFFAARFADKNPRFTFLDLHSEKRRFFGFAESADFSFHSQNLFIKSNFILKIPPQYFSHFRVKNGIITSFTQQLIQTTKHLISFRHNFFARFG
jgi:hypothetical protein